jgi:hypothetical protein
MAVARVTAEDRLMLREPSDHPYATPRIRVL